MGVPILLMPSWFLFAAYIVLSGQSLLRNDVGSGQAYGVALAFALLLLASVVLHEIGHCLVARAFGLPVRSITITLLAGLTEITEPPQTPAREYAVAVTGPMVSLLLAATGVAAMDLFAPGSVPRLLCAGVGVTNGAIAALNLLPGLPLDGGRVLRSVLWQLGQDPERATRVSARAGMGIALVVVPAVLLGVLPAVGIGDHGPTTILLSALIGAFIYVGARASLRRSNMISKLPQVSVAALARPALAVPATLPLAEAVRLAHEMSLRALVVVDGNGRLEGIVSEAWVRQVPPDRRPWVVVADGARRVEPGLLLEPGLQGEALLAAMRGTPASEYVVPGPAPRVLVAADVAAAMEV
ncbi:MAG: Zn-dependent protease-like protein [Frankiales bacterium]|nr:Zn-dependent protease-like protein [Frankiales bacterium]